MLYSELKLDPNLAKSVEELGFVECTEVQDKTFEHTFEGRDVIIQSKTGTGKTAAFLVSIFQFFQTNPDVKKYALILVPTRELAIQIEKEAKAISKYLDYKIASFYGGVGYGKQEIQLKDGVDILIATPGRLIDYVKSKKIELKTISYFVVDEADRMFDLGFSQDIEFIIKKLPPSENLRSIFLSATINQKVKIFASRFIKDGIEIDLSPDSLIVENIEHYVTHVSIREKFNLLLGLIKHKNPANAFIFTNTKSAAVKVAEKLKVHGIKADFIIGDLPQAKRTKIINRIKNGDFQFLVATDVAARGIHVDNLEMVVNYDLPEDPENYVHRVGRTARAGQKGVAYSLACEKFVYGLEALEKFLDSEIPVFWPEDEYFIDDSDVDYSSIQTLERKGKPARGKSGRPERSSSKQTRKSSSQKNVKTKATSKKKAVINKQGKAASSAKSKTNKPLSKSKTVIKKSAQAPKRKQKLESRLKHYQEKYGETFTVTHETKRKKKSVFGSIVDSISSLFKKKS